MSGDELDRHIDDVFARDRERMVPITLRMPPDLLQRTKREAERRHIPYQRLIKALLDDSISRLEKTTPSET